MELPIDHSIVSHVREGLPRLCVNDSKAVLDGEQFKLTFSDNSGTFESQVWEPYQRDDETWIKLIDSVRGAGLLVRGQSSTRLLMRFVTKALIFSRNFVGENSE